MKISDPSTATDTQLLAQFEEGQDQSAFAELVSRHGAMVMNVAMRNLPNREDAEDAFQATFFALAKAANRLRQKELLAAWLHNTVRKTASSIQRGIARRTRRMERTRELATNVNADSITNPADDVAKDELVKILDEEIGRLPKKLQVVIILCHLEGLSQELAAKRLGIPTSTVCDRSAKARSLLKGQLVRRGVNMTLAGLTTYLVASSSKASAAMSASLTADTTTKALLYAAGKSAAEIGANSTVIHTANKVISTMTTARLAIIGLSALAVLILTNALTGVVGVQTQAGMLFIDDFSDGSATNGNPVSWTPIGDSTLDASTGDLIITGRLELDDSPNPDWRFSGASVLETYSDVSFRTQVRLLQDESWIIASVRDTADMKNGYGVGISYWGSLLYGRFQDPGEDLEFDPIPTNMHPMQEDVVLQVDVFGDTIDLWAWRPDEEMPPKPLVTWQDTALERGFLSVWIGGVGSDRDVSGILRSAQVSTTSIPSARSQASPTRVRHTLRADRSAALRHLRQHPTANSDRSRAR